MENNIDMSVYAEEFIELSDNEVAGLSATERNFYNKRYNYYKRMGHYKKPCWVLDFCPYGSLTEQQKNMYHSKYKLPSMMCEVYGFDCPVYVNASDDSESNLK